MPYANGAVAKSGILHPRNVNVLYLAAILVLQERLVVCVIRIRIIWHIVSLVVVIEVVIVSVITIIVSIIISIIVIVVVIAVAVIIVAVVVIGVVIVSVTVIVIIGGCAIISWRISIGVSASGEKQDSHAQANA